MIAIRTLQQYLANQGLYKGPDTGEMNLELRDAISRALKGIPWSRNWSAEKKLLAMNQVIWARYGYYQGQINGERNMVTETAESKWEKVHGDEDLSYGGGSKPSQHSD